MKIGIEEICMFLILFYQEFSYIYNIPITYTGVHTYIILKVFDTELIGEGAIGTYNHANQDLLTPDRIVVPGRARMYAQVK